MKSCDVGGNDDDYSFDLYLSRFVETCVFLFTDATNAYINSAFTHIHIRVTDQLLWNCWELSALHKGTLTVAIKERKNMCRIRTPSGE